ncbi:hypothetical protein [Haloarchaeobius sp. TZWWS8]|uniref:hypothetical protein n=1 Tax=Haloarchaeobius sp. TZWWS8 TaxID=3446121 RepID=UPI003EC153BF
MDPNASPTDEASVHIRTDGGEDDTGAYPMNRRELLLSGASYATIGLAGCDAPLITLAQVRRAADAGHGTEAAAVYRATRRQSASPVSAAGIDAASRIVSSPGDESGADGHESEASDDGPEAVNDGVEAIDGPESRANESERVDPAATDGNERADAVETTESAVSGE